MFSSRKEMDEVENALSQLVEEQLKVQRTLGSMPTEIRRDFSEELKLTESALSNAFQGELKNHSDWLEKALHGLFHEIKSQHDKVASSLETLATQNREQSERQSAMVIQLKALEEFNQRLAAQLEAHREEWRDTQDYELSDETPQALGEWCDHVTAELVEFESCEGMVRLFAGRLHKHMNGLRQLLANLASAPDNLEAKLEDLQRLVFAPELGVSWGNLTPANSTASQRRQLHLLEKATQELCARVREELRRVTGIMMMEVVPGETRFDARLHESSEFLESPTSDATLHNLITAVERPGYQKFAPDGSFVLLQSARVRRAVLAAKNEGVSEMVAPESDVQSAPEVEAPIEKMEGARRVTGPL